MSWPKATALCLSLLARVAAAERDAGTETFPGADVDAGTSASTAPPEDGGTDAPREATRAATSGVEQAKTDISPPAALESVVTATRLPRPLREVAATVWVLPRAELERSPSLTTDGVLRALPSVATFRRSSSLVSDPSAQGLNLRGLGPSGVSRSLVLSEGVPLNDPFGGWIYWRALPRLGLERVEVMPSGGSALYGSSALGGVVQLFPRRLEGRSLEGEASVGLLRTATVAARGTGALGGVRASLEGEWLSSAGHPVIAADQRGEIDGAAPSQHATLNARVDAAPHEHVELSARLGLFRERQNGGTAFTAAEVDAGLAAFHARWHLGEAQVEAALFGKLQRFGQTRARIPPDRSREVLAATQEVPADEEGASLTWRSGTLARLHLLSAGLDLRRVAGHSEETLAPPTVTATSPVERRAGGAQQFAGLFLQDLVSLTPRLRLEAALRLDGWRNLSGVRAVTFGDGHHARTELADRHHEQLSPRVGLLYQLSEALAVRASGYRAFRAPTLNELYRPFQVGTVLTAANEGLGPERLWGAEAGVELAGSSAWAARATGFWNWLDAPITNVTLATPLPDGSSRQRQNLGQAQVRGVEAGVEARPARPLTLSLAYTLADARVVDPGGASELRGKQLPQDPHHRGTATVAFADPRLFTAAVQCRVVGPQFEDDLNTLPMAGYVLFDISVSRRLFGPLELFASVENLFDRPYLVGRAGVDTVGQPRLARLGLRLR